MLLAGVSDLYRATRRGTETPPVVHTAPAQRGLLASYVAEARRANATLVVDASYPDATAEERDFLWLEELL